MDVKSTFLNEHLEEEVYIDQPEWFTLSIDKEYVCRLKKYLYGLKQAPGALYSWLDKYLQEQGFKIGVVDKNLYYKIENDDQLIVVVRRMCQDFSMKIQKEFEMSMLGELSFFLGLQVSQFDKGIFIS